MGVGHLLAAATGVLLASCASEADFDRASDDFVVTIADVTLASGDALTIGFHPTDAPPIIDGEGIDGALLICPVDSMGVLMPGAEVAVPPCGQVTNSQALAETDGRLHTAVGFRTPDTAAAQALTLRYRQADGYFALFYAGEPRRVRLTGPSRASPWVTNFGESPLLVNGLKIEPGNTVEITNASLAVDLQPETGLEIDWFGERAPFSPEPGP